MIGCVGIDSWRPCSLLGLATLAALGVSGDADAGQVRGQLVAAHVAVLRQLRKSDDLADGEVMGAHSSGRE